MAKTPSFWQAIRAPIRKAGFGRQKTANPQWRWLAALAGATVGQF
jgi:hypothetical protein